jgi:hypothetical protein
MTALTPETRAAMLAAAPDLDKAAAAARRGDLPALSTALSNSLARLLPAMDSPPAEVLAALFGLDTPDDPPGAWAL